MSLPEGIIHTEKGTGVVLHTLLKSGAFDHVKEGQQMILKPQFAQRTVNHLNVDVEVIIPRPFGLLILFVPGALKSGRLAVRSSSGSKLKKLQGVKFVPPAVRSCDSTNL